MLVERFARCAASCVKLTAKLPNLQNPFFTEIQTYKLLLRSFFMPFHIFMTKARERKLQKSMYFSANAYLQRSKRQWLTSYYCCKRILHVAWDPQVDPQVSTIISQALLCTDFTYCYVRRGELSCQSAISTYKLGWYLLFSIQYGEIYYLFSKLCLIERYGCNRCV